MTENKRTKELNERLSVLYQQQKFYNTLLIYSKCNKRSVRRKIKDIEFCLNAVELELHKERKLLSIKK